MTIIYYTNMNKQSRAIVHLN